MKVSELAKQLPSNYYVDGCMLWVGDIHVDIDYTDISLLKLDYEAAIKKMILKLEKQ